MGKAIIKAALGLVAIIALPFIVLGVAIGATILSAKAIVKMGVRQAPVKPAKAKAQEPIIDKPILDFNKVPYGREDTGGTC